MDERTKSKLWIVPFLLLLMFGTFPVCTSATEKDNTVIYDASEIALYRDRTIQEIADRYSAARYAGETYSDSYSSTWYSVPASIKSPYAAGVLTEDTHEVMTAMTNFYRWLVGVPELKAGSQHSDSLQAQALDRNFEFSHYIHSSSKPADMDQELWDAGFVCTHDILARFSTPMNAVNNWMSEGYSLKDGTWDTVGHRYALIGANTSEIWFGYSGGVTVGEIMEYQNAMETPFAAFPAPGYMPLSLVSPNYSSWTVELNPLMLNVADVSDLQVTITDLSTGETYERSEANGTLQYSGSVVNFVQPGAPEVYTDEYSVVISGLTDETTGKPAEIRYEINFVDIKKYAPSYITDTLSGFAKYMIYEDMANDLDKVAAILPDEITVIAENGSQVIVPLSGSWTVDRNNSCFVNSADADSLPSRLTDKNGLLKRITIPYEITSESYNLLRITPTQVKAGEKVEFRMYRMVMSTDTSRIYRLTEDKDGRWSSVLAFDSASSADFDQKQSDQEKPWHIYNHTALKTDSGEYISVYYESIYMSEEWGGTTAYVSTDTKTLTVETEENNPAGLPFRDVNAKYWYYDTVRQAYEIGLMTGTSETAFEPDNPMSRGMVATVLYRIAGAPNVTYQSVFRDVPGTAYYAQAVTWAYQNKIISGYGNGTFGPDDNVTREEMAVMLCNYARFLGLPVNSSQGLEKFSDYKNTTAYAVPSMKWVVERGILSGTEDGRLNPTSDASRAECAKMLLLSYKNIF